MLDEAQAAPQARRGAPLAPVPQVLPAGYGALYDGGGRGAADAGVVGMPEEVMECFAC